MQGTFISSTGESHLNQRTKGQYLVILSAVVFGFTPLIAKTIYANGGKPVGLTFLRLFGGMPCLLLMHSIVSGTPLTLRKKELMKIGLCSLGYALTPVFLLSSYNYISSGMATTIHFVYPALVLLGCMIVFNEKVTRVEGLCCVLCMSGIFCFFTPGSAGNLAGVVIAFTSGITYAYYIIYLSRSGLQSMPPYKLGFYFSALGSIEVFLVLLFKGEFSFSLTPIGWGLSLLYAMLSVLATITFQIGAKYIGPQKASLLSTFEPLTSICIGVSIFHEQMALRSIFGIVCILSAVMLLTLGNRKVD
jgi:drug/metabolite transporter (DMT)-like permease